MEIDVSKCKYNHDIFNIKGERKNMCILHDCRCNSIHNSDCYYKQLQQLKQCLDDIYEICDKELCKGEIKDLDMYAQMEMIIQKIKEVENNEQ